ncbi:MAG: YqaA family protein [Candidatus Puniceispirillales bacterium]
MAEKPSLYDRMILTIPGMQRLQDWVISLGNRPSALHWLLGLTFLESIIFPIPTDPLLAGMVLARPQHYIRLTLLMTVASVLGGIGGWMVGVYLGQAVTTMGWLGDSAAYEAITAALERHGWLLILIGALTPFPYKLTVVTAGFFGIGALPLVLASMVGRGIRYFLVASIIRFRQNTALASLLTAVLVGLFVFFGWYVQ